MIGLNWSSIRSTINPGSEVSKEILDLMQAEFKNCLCDRLSIHSSKQNAKQKITELQATGQEKQLSLLPNRWMTSTRERHSDSLKLPQRLIYSSMPIYLFYLYLLISSHSPSNKVRTSLIILVPPILFFLPAYLPITISSSSHNANPASALLLRLRLRAPRLIQAQT